MNKIQVLYNKTLSISVGSGSDVIIPEDKSVFLYAMLLSIGVGGLSSLLFHLTIKPADKTMKKVFLQEQT